MITQWDIISSIRPSDNAILYALLIDGTEHDARLIAKKLKGYVRQPQPAMAPYVYSFPLPEDLDESTLEKIRVAVREGIEQAKKVNEFVPGGSLGNPLFHSDTNKEDKDFPTFITLDPSESFFRAGQSASKTPPPPVPPVDRLERKQIDLSEPEEEIPQIAKTLEEIDQEGYRSDPPSESLSETKADLPDEERGDLPWDTAPDLHRPEKEKTTPTPEENMLTSIESDEVWSDEPPASSQTQTPPPLNTENIHLEMQGITPEPPTNRPAPPLAHTPLQPAQNPQPDGDLPLTDRDMLIKDMDGTMLGQSLDDIFLAETKYDMFMDLEPASVSKNNAKSDDQKTSGQSPVAPGQDGGHEQPESSRFSPAPDRPAGDPENNAFNIFDQKIKDQTNFIDLEDVQGITERITQKDLSFLKHAQLPQAKMPQRPAPQQPEAAIDKTRAYMPAPSSFGRIDDNPQEVMDPFEQMLASAQQQQTPPEEQSASPEISSGTASQTAGAVPVMQAAETEEEETTKKEASAMHVQTAAPAEVPDKEAPAIQTQRTNRVIPPPTTPITEKNMSENQGDKKPILRIKRKAQPDIPAPQQQPHAAPVPPQAPAAAQPQQIPPQHPAQQEPPQPAPAPARPQQPAPVAQPLPVPQEEKHGTTILRRRRTAGTFLEKTRTIDHSIELPLSELKKHNWPLEVPLIPTYTLENMTISVNRFAHATAISVIDNPGKLYNPLVLHGASGTGKTHFLHAIGYALSNKYGQENIFITNGVRLSRGIQRYVMEGNMDKFENFTSSIKALLIDDIHLIAINEQNRAHLSKLLNDFLKQQKQIVITSKYPPESLAKLEELLNFRLDSGWISELKPASGTARMRIIQKMLTDNGINITNDDIARFFGQANMSLGTVSRSIRRVRVLEKLIFPSEEKEKRSTTAIFDQLLATEGEDQSSLIAQKYPNDITSAPVIGNGEWGRIGFFYPQNHSNMMNWLVFALQQRAKELGISGGPELAVRSSYSTENIISSAFKIANLCDNKKLKGAVILGPEVTACDPSVRENFYDILTHMLEIMLIRCGVINYEDVSAPSTYVKILSELLR